MSMRIHNIVAGSRIGLRAVEGRYTVELSAAGTVWWTEPYAPDNTGSNWPPGATAGDLWLVSTNGNVYLLSIGG